MMNTQAELYRTTEEAFSAGSAVLFRRSVVPAGTPFAYLAVLHGYGDHSGRYLELMQWLAARGIACHALDFRGHGKAQGRPGHVERWEEYLEDLDAFLRLEELGAGGRGAPLFALGHSHGGLVLAAAGIRGLPGVSGCIFSAPYFRSAMRVPAIKIWAARLANPLVPALRIDSGLRPEWMSRDEARVRDSIDDPLIVRTATPRWYLTCHAAQSEIVRRAEEFRLPLLVLAGDADAVADSRAAHDFYLRAGAADKTFRLYPEHRHELLRELGRELIFQHVLDWISERLEPE